MKNQFLHNQISVNNSSTIYFFKIRWVEGAFPRCIAPSRTSYVVLQGSSLISRSLRIAILNQRVYCVVKRKSSITSFLNKFKKISVKFSVGFNR
jgi:hypothetical protein